MKPLPEKFTTVIAGAWNAGIFSPDWISTHLAAEHEVDVEIGFAPGILTSRFKWNGLILIPQTQRLTIGVDTDCSRWKDAVAVAVTVLELLPHTPVSALGVNFGFTQPIEDGQGLKTALEFADDAELIRAGCTIGDRQLVRQLTLHDRLLNLRISQTAPDNFEIHINYHRAVTRSQDARDAASDSIAQDLYEQAQELLQSAYHLEVKNADE